MAVIYLFTEGADGCSQVQFWKLINTFVFQDKLRIVPCNGVSNVLKEIEKREICEDAQQRIDPDSDILLLDIDYVDDNQRLENILMDIIEYSDTHKNACLIDELCFEDTVIGFKYFKNWVYSKKLRESEEGINILELLETYKKNIADWRNCSLLYDYMFSKFPGKFRGSKVASKEMVAAAVLIELTSKTQDFHVNKEKIGKCWFCDCNDKENCSLYFYDKRDGSYQKTKITAEKMCGLSSSRKDSQTKIRQLFRYTALYAKVKRARAELLRNGYSIAELL